MDLINTYIKYDDSITEEQINKVLDIAEGQGFHPIGSVPNYSGLKMYGALRFSNNKEIQSVCKYSSFSENQVYVKDILGETNESWCVKVTKENRSVVKNWLKTQTPNYSGNSLNVDSQYGIHNNNCAYNTCSGLNSNSTPFNEILTTEEFYRKIGHVSESEFKVGDWYTCSCNDGLYEYKEQGKSSEHLNFSRVINPTNRKFMSHKPHSISKDQKDSCLCYFSPSKKADMSVVNKYLNQDKPDIEVILEECKRRFPKGCKVRSAYNNVKNIIIGESLEIQNNNKVHDGSTYLYYDGKYATLVEESVPVYNTDPIKRKDSSIELLEDDVLEVKTKKKIKRNSLNIQLIN